MQQPPAPQQPPTPPQQPPDQPLDAHALLIQIAQYPRRPRPDVSDAADLAEVLQDPALCGYPPAQVRVLRDPQATRAAMLAELRSLVFTAGADSAVVLYFSGHGGQLGETTYLLPFDADPAAIATTALSVQDFTRELAPLRARKVLLIFDCGHAGGLEAEHAARNVPESAAENIAKDAAGLRPGLSAAARDALLQGRGWALLTASDVDEPSHVLAGQRNSVFTKHLLAGLRGERPGEDGHLRIFDLYEHLQPRVTREVPQQHPIFQCALNESFAIARYRGGALSTVPRTDDGFLYDALLSYANADAPLVRALLLPRLLAAGLRVATTSDLAEPGLDRILNIERGLERARRTIVVLSRAFLRHDSNDDLHADYLALQYKRADITKGRYSLVPVYLEDPDLLSHHAGWLTSLVGINLDPGTTTDADEAMARLLRAIARPVQRR